MKLLSKVFMAYFLTAGLSTFAMWDEPDLDRLQEALRDGDIPNIKTSLGSLDLEPEQYLNKITWDGWDRCGDSSYRDIQSMRPVEEAIFTNDEDILGCFVPGICDPNSKLGSGTMYSDYPLLSAAVLAGADKSVKLLLKSRADIDQPTDDGSTPLHLAIGESYTGMVRLLLKKGADITISNQDKKTPKALAQEKLEEFAESDPEMVRRYTDIIGLLEKVESDEGGAAPEDE